MSHVDDAKIVADLIALGEDDEMFLSKSEIAEETFRMCVMETLGDVDFMVQYRRLTGSKIGAMRSPIEKMVDKACAHNPVSDSDWHSFFAFVRDYVWRPWINILNEEAKREA